VQDIADWLDKLGMAEYAQRFAENRIDFFVLPDLTDQDLEKMGVVLGDRRKILRAIAGLDDAEKAAQKPGASVEATSAVRPRDAAERRQVTVMFSDLVGSTALSARMDPEDLRAVISAYQKCVAQVVQRFAGAQMVILAVRSDRFRELTRRRSLVCLATCGYRPKRLDLAFADADIPVVNVAGRITVPRHEPQLLIDLQYALGIVDDAVLV